VESYEEQYFRLLNEIEKIARSFLEVKFNSAQELWELEIALVNYQSGLWEAINNEQAIKQEAKARKTEIVFTKLEGWMSQVRQLDTEIEQIDNRIKIYRYAQRLSRELGDAFAWVLLGDWLIPLTKKPPEPSHDGHNLPKDHGLTGILATAIHLGNAGFGFPLLHDITNCLCIGDITFCSPDSLHTTIEVKTHLEEKKEGKTTFDIQTDMIFLNSAETDKWNAVRDRIPKLPSSVDEASERAEAQYPRQQSPRRKRQVERMKEAKVWQSMPANQVFEFGDNNRGIKNFFQPDETTHNWKIVLDLIMKAKADGIASCPVDNAFVYLATYNNPPLVYPWSKGQIESILQQADDKIRADITSIFYPYSEREKNIPIWGPTGDPPSDAIPFFMYSLPADIIMDIMWGRVTISVLVVNLGKIVAALEEIRLEVKLPKDKEEFEQFLPPISAQRVLSDGRIVKVELHQIRSIAQKMFYEFLSIPGFVRLIQGYIDASSLVNLK